MQDTYWADARKRMLPDARAGAMLTEIYYTRHGHMEALNESQRLRAHKKCERDQVPYLTWYTRVYGVPENDSKVWWWARILPPASVPELSVND